MYLAVIVLLMAVVPLGSMLVEHFAYGADDRWALTGKWFVFWAVGVRLPIAGLSQVFNPAFTAEAIFGIRDKASHVIVQELGFGNLAIGLLGALTLVAQQWLVPAAVAGAVFYGLAGANHVVKGNRNVNETIAMVSDIFIFFVLAAYLAAISWQPE